MNTLRSEWIFGFYTPTTTTRTAHRSRPSVVSGRSWREPRDPRAARAFGKKTVGKSGARHWSRAVGREFRNNGDNNPLRDKRIRRILHVRQDESEVIINSQTVQRYNIRHNLLTRGCTDWRTTHVRVGGRRPVGLTTVTHTTDIKCVRSLFSDLIRSNIRPTNGKKHRRLEWKNGKILVVRSNSLL